MFSKYLILVSILCSSKQVFNQEKNQTMSDLDFLNDAIAQVPCPLCTGKNECAEHCFRSIASHCLHSPLPSGHLSCFLKCVSTPPLPTMSFSTYFCFKRQLGAIHYSYKIQENITNVTVRENADIIFKN